MKVTTRWLALALSAGLSASGQAAVVISEYVEGSSNNKALELLNTGPDSVNLAAWELQVYFNGSQTPGLTVNLEGDIAPGANFVFAHASAIPAILAVADQTTTSGLFNGDDAITLLNGGAVHDSIGQIGIDPGSYWGSGDIRTQNATLRRRDGAAADTNPFDSYDPSQVFDGFPQDNIDDLGAANDGGDGSQPPAGPDMSCGADATPINAIQGSGDASPLVGQTVVVEAVVSRVSNGNGELGGFFLEARLEDRDNDPRTSEGLFVYAPSTSASPGQLLRIAAEVTEFGGLTELAPVSDIADCGSADLPPAMAVTLPWTSADAAEAFEGMRVQFPQALVVNDNYDLGRYGSLTLGSARAFIPTQVVSPGSDAALLAEMNALDRLILDDGSNRQNPATIPYPTPELSASQTVRAGDTVSQLQGVLDYRYGEWRLQPTAAPVFQPNNLRTPAPELSDRGNLVVASFNVLNFFNGDGLGGNFPTARGAHTAEELARQTDKLVSAMQALDADIIGLMEIENDGYSEISAIAELASALGDDWAFVDPGLSQLGSDAITVGLIYRADRVAVVGDAATLSTSPFDTLNRQPLAQTFRRLDSSDGVTVVVNHFKSKGCNNAEGDNADQGDGQGCWNPVRTHAASALASWLANDATGTGESDVLVIGDLNSYTQEAPIRTLEDSGYNNLVASLLGDQAYTYVFYGQAGSLDHALANQPLTQKVVAAAVWSINADEPRALDYNMEFKSSEQQASLYAADPYRASDHDPVLVALTMDTSTLAERADLNGDGRIDGRDVARFILAYLFGQADDVSYDIDANGRVDLDDLEALFQARRPV
ncbi:ExeM/NucH family extracellular endonuclease [Marinobacter zhejiangensis]|uniref:LTD domain-containing protein n=1 Tax=Marinobacter zhejiangensis TaxID=488535 RepID=A0A1I4M9Z2_9GAMM|nr:ExeM/NucH family extracellular endonuclease [Marinobacter zhejiangensis]SFM00111.1 hypothetical protein SAMN04487963_0950 [Marinobacter zhejiangensis]